MDETYQLDAAAGAAEVTPAGRYDAALKRAVKRSETGRSTERTGYSDLDDAFLARLREECIAAIEATVAAERARCAAIARDFTRLERTPFWPNELQVCDEIAEAIERGEP